LRSGRKLCTSLALCWRDPARKSACCIRRRASDDEVTRACLFFSPPPHLSRKRILIRFAAAGAHIYFWPRAPDQEGGGDTGPNLLLALISLQPGQSADFNTFFCTNRRRPTRLLRHRASLSQKSSHRLHFVCFCRRKWVEMMRVVPRSRDHFFRSPDANFKVRSRFRERKIVFGFGACDGAVCQLH